MYVNDEIFLKRAKFLYLPIYERWLSPPARTVIKCFCESKEEYIDAEFIRDALGKETIDNEVLRVLGEIMEFFRAVPREGRISVIDFIWPRVQI